MVSVEEEPFFWINGVAAQTELKSDLIDLSVFIGHTGSEGIQRRRAQAIPQYRVRQENLRVWTAPRCFKMCYRRSVWRTDLVADLCAVTINEMRFNQKAAHTGIIKYRRKQYALRPIIGKIKMCGWNTNEIYIPVQAAEYGEITGQRIDVIAFAIVNKNS